MVENGKIKKIHIVEPARKVKRNQRGEIDESICWASDQSEKKTERQK